MKKKEETSIDTLLYIKIFALLVGIAVIGSIFVKTFFVVKNSTFTGNTYNILVVGDSTYIIGANKKEKKITVVTVDKQINNPKKSGLLKYSLETGVPLSGVIEYKNGKIVSMSQDFFSFANLFTLINNNKIERHNIEVLDIVKLSMLSLSVSKDNFITFDARKSKGEELFEIFKDDDIINSKVSIEVINGAGIDGLGGKFSTMLSNVGYNVIAVNTRGSISDSLIVSHVKNKISKRLSNDIGFDTISDEKEGIADISVLIGEDVVLNLED